MKLTSNAWFVALKGVAAFLAASALASIVMAQGFSTTTVQGTVYLANGTLGGGTLQLSWPAFTTANNQTVAAGRTTATIGADGFVSVNLAPNLGATPAGLFYTAVYNMKDGTTSTEYWVVPVAAQASIAQVRAQVMPAAQAVQAVNKAYVDQAIQSLSLSSLAPSGGSLTGPLYLSSDPTQPMQASDKHYVDATFSQAVPLTGASMTGPLTSVQLGAAYQVDQFPGADFGAKLQACLSSVPVNGGTCDARNFTGTQSMASNLAISTPNTTIQLPCATISTASQVIVTAGTRNVALHGCALRGASNTSGSQGGTVFLYSGSGSVFQVGDSTYASDTSGFHLDNVVINTTAANYSSTEALSAYRTQEMDLESLYLLGNSNQTAMTLDGTGNYTGGTFYDNAFSGFQTAVYAIGHQISNSATTDWLNASTFVRLHIDCPTSNGNPISGTFGINLQQGDGNTFTGGDVEGCNTALHLGANAQNNMVIGLRNENSNSQVVADSGSAYNNWITGGTMFTGKLTDNGTRNSFLDTFHRSFNGINGDWYGSQQDATVTNHYRLGIGSGLERGFLDRYQTDYGYRWTTGLSDATAGEQFYQVLDELNNVYRLSIGQYNNGQSSTNNQTVINSAGTGAVVLNGSNNSGSGGVVFGSGGASEATVATVDNVGNAQFSGSLGVGGTSTFAGSTTARNQADAEIDSFLWAGTTANQKESFTYKGFTGASQWYMVKDTSNNWALNSAPGELDSFKAYQSTNSGDTYINASNSSGAVRVNYENGSGSQFKVYGGNSSAPYASFTGTTSIQFPGLAAGTGHNCLQVDNSGYLSNTGSACASGTVSGTVNSGASGQIAYYSGSGTALSGMSTIPVSAGGTGAISAGNALVSLGAQAAMPGVASDGANGLSVTGNVTPQKAVYWNNVNNTPAIPSVPGHGYFVNPSMFSSNTFTTPLYSANSNHIWSLYSQNLVEAMNQNQNGYNMKPGYTPFEVVADNYGEGSTNPISIINNQYGLGDTFGISNLQMCYGGTTAGGDEGCEDSSEWAQQGYYSYDGTITSGGTSGSTSITINPARGSGTQGDGRWLLDLTQTISAGIINAMSGGGSTFTTMTGSGTSWPVSTVSTTLGTAVFPGVKTVTPASMTGITTSTVLCIADGGNFETVTPTATTGTTFTATFLKSHLSTSIVAAGGLCGYYVYFPSDTATSGSGNLYVPWPVIRSTSTTSMDVWIAGTGAYASYQGSWSAGTNNTYVLAPGAEVVYINNGGASVSNTLTLMPNTVAWTNGDTVDEPLYPYLALSGGHSVITRFTNGGGATFGRSYYFNGNINNGGLFYVVNGTAPSFYSAANNHYPPFGTEFIGPWSQALMLQSAPSGSVVSVGGCSYTGTCGTTTYLQITSGASGSDELQYNQTAGAGSWYLSAGFNNGGFHFSSAGGTQTMDGSGPLNLGSSTQPTTIVGTSASLPGASFSSSAITLSPTVNLPGSSSFSGGAITLGQTVTVANGTIASGAGFPLALQPASGEPLNLGGSRIYNYADQYAANINATGYYGFVASGWGATSWKMQGVSGIFNLIDSVNSVNQFSCNAGTGTTGSCSVAGTANANALKVGSTHQTTFDANGVKHEAGTVPTVSSGTIVGTSAGGYVSGLSAVASVTITFANSGWTTWASCTANATVTGSDPFVTSTLGLKTSVTFTFPSTYTGGITYSCVGN